MTRNPKAFGLALMAAIALGAIGAQGASAVVEHEFHSDSVNGKTVLTGSMEASTEDRFSATAGLPVDCSVGTFSGTVTDNNVDTVTVHPKYSSCDSPLDEDVIVDTDGCNYVFGTDTTEEPNHGSAGQEHASVKLECDSPHSASPHKIRITATGCNLTFEATHAGNVVVNHNMHGVRYTNLDGSSAADAKHSSKSAVTVSATVKTIKYTADAGSFCGLAGHAAGTYSNGTYTGVATVTGYEDSSASTGTTTAGTTWHHGPQVDIWVSSPSAVVSHQFQFDAANEKTVLTGSLEPGTSHVFSTTASLRLECTTITLSGTVEGNSVDTVTLHPKYSSCGSPIDENIIWDADGCNYVFDSDTTETISSQEHASVSLECESAHSASPHKIRMTATGCTMTFETTHAGNVVVNHSMHGVRYTNLDGSSTEDAKHSSKSAITIISTLKTIQYTAEAGSFCGLAGHAAGTYSNGTTSATFSVTGYEDSSASTGTTTAGTTWHHGPQVNVWVSSTP